MKVKDDPHEIRDTLSVSVNQYLAFLPCPPIIMLLLVFEPPMRYLHTRALLVHASQCASLVIAPVVALPQSGLYRVVGGDKWPRICGPVAAPLRDGKLHRQIVSHFPVVHFDVSLLATAMFTCASVAF